MNRLRAYRIAHKGGQLNDDVSMPEDQEIETNSLLTGAVFPESLRNHLFDGVDGAHLLVMSLIAKELSTKRSKTTMQEINQTVLDVLSNNLVLLGIDKKGAESMAGSFATRASTKRVDMYQIQIRELFDDYEYSWNSMRSARSQVP